MVEVTLRYGITATDRAAIGRITASTGFFTDDEVDIAYEVFDDCLRDPKAGYEFVVALVDGEIAGYASWGHDEQTVASYELYWIVVDTSVQAAGIGGKLLKYVEDAIRRGGPGRQLFVETAGKEQYLPTRKFYERQGYTQAAWLDDYWAPGDARVIFSKRL